MRITKAMAENASLIAYVVSHNRHLDFDIKPEKPKPYGEIERSGKSRKSDRKRAPKWGRK